MAAAIVSSKPNTLTTKDTVLSTSSARLSDTLGLVPPIILTAGLLVATVESWLWTGSEARTWLTVVTAGVVVLLAVLAGRAHSAPEADRRRSQEQASADPDPPVIPTAISPVRRFLPEATAAGVGAGLCLLATNAHQTIALAAAIVLLAMTVALALHLDGDGSPLVLSFAAGAASGTVVGIHLAPVTGAGAIGVLACVFLVLSGIVVILHGLAAWSAGRNLRAASWMKPWPRHVPLVALIGIWVLVAFATVPTTVHQVRTVERTAATTPPMVDAAVREWLGTTSGADDGPTPRPMLLVGASGGGTKAAYWTTLILDCLVGGEMPAGDTECGESDDRQGPERLQRLFLTSSVSGGSVGVLHFVSHLTHDPDLAVEWIETRVGREVLSPLTAWGLVHDLPIFLLGWPTDPNRCAGGEGSCAIHADRALVQEAAIGNYGNALRTNPGPGIRTANTGGPRTIFNGALDGSVGRILISPLDLAPVYPESEACRAQDGRLRPVTGALDAADVLADDRDLPLVSAALLSARFPMLEPPGRVGTEAGKDLRGCEAVPRTAVRVRDGGYVENTGLLTIAELLPTIRATLDAEGAERMPIIVLSIDDDSAIADPNPELEEPAANPLTVASRVSSGYLTRKARDTLSSCQVDGVYSLRVSPPPHVGAHAATGWEISETARRLDLGRAASTGDVLRQINELRGMLDGTRPVPVC